jgi:hypothetical protein
LRAANAAHPIVFAPSDGWHRVYTDPDLKK